MTRRVSNARGVLLLLMALLVRVPTRAAAGEVSFRNDVMAVLSKAGCNAGACHGNANGKGGFKLSLRGEDWEFDFKALTRDQFGRRIDLISPERSLLLLKAAAALAHEGGKRFDAGSDEFEILRRWIASGAKADPPSTPTLTSIQVSPEEKILVAPDSSLQLTVRAKFSDGTERDVSSAAVYEVSNPIVKITREGLVTREADGETTVIVRHLQAQKPVRLAFIPARPEFRWKNPVAQNFIDEHVFAKLRALRLNASKLCLDEVFIRRAHLDLLGLLPTAEEARQFVLSAEPEKRAKLVDRLLERPEFADFWALKWADLLRVEERALDQKGMQGFHHWIRRSLAENKPLDRFVRELLTARGSTYQNPAANFYRANRDAVTRSVAVGEVFLGTRLQCAQCHSHPFDRWTQDDYYDWAAVFAKVSYKVLENRREDSNDSHEFKGEQIVFISRKGEVKNPRTEKPATPRFLGSAETASAGGEELERLAAWLTSPENPFFARVQANRVWYHLMGRGIVDPVDDFRATNPPSHPALLDALSEDFVRHQFDLRHLIRLIMNSRTYQLASEPDETNREDEANFSHAAIRRLGAEQLLDCQHQAAGVAPGFSGYPAGTRASQLPGLNFEKRRNGKNSANDQFLKLFGKPPRLLTCECERSSETTMGQTFQMISGPAINDLLARPDNRLTALSSNAKSSREAIEELYWTALTRPPTPVEQTAAEAHLARAASQREGLEDLLWSLLNAKEFILRK